MIFKKLLLFALVLGLLLPQALAQEVLTLPQAIERATANNPSLNATRARLGITEAEIMTAGALRNPALVSDNGVAEKTYRLGVEQTFRLGNKRRKQVSLAQAQRDVLLTEINTAILELRADVRRAYTSLFNAQQGLDVAKDRVEANKHLVEVAQHRGGTGGMANLDVQQAQLAVFRAENDVLVARSAVVQARTALNVLLGQPLDTAWELTTPNVQPQAPPGSMLLEPVPLNAPISLQQADLKTLTREALARRPEMKQNRREVTVAARQLDVAKANRIPDLSLTVGPDYIAEPDQQRVGVFVIATFEMPFFNRQQGPILEAKARRIQLSAQQTVIQNHIASEVMNAYTDFTLYQERIQRFETELLPAAEQVATIYRRSFEDGKAPILAVLAVQQEYMQMRVEYLQAMQEYQNAISDLERAVGTGL